ncbi:MAG: hypothetical protein HOP21_06415 [Methylotenera sp.]|nr:hypothetical protein [Methylotenera sp.]
MKKIKQYLVFLSSSLVSLTCLAEGIVNATQDGMLGLYQSSDITITTGQCTDCPIPPQARWYFKNELIAVPKPSVPMAGFSTTENAQQDILKTLDTKALPVLIWVGSHQIADDVAISSTGHMMTLDNGFEYKFNIVPKISTNLSYWDHSTLHFFHQRLVRARGELEGETFTARTVWPLDFTVNPQASLKPLAQNETLKTLVQFENGGAKSAYESRLLWERKPGIAKQSASKAVMAFMLNGAQGDDDEAHGGHFAVVTGRMEADGNPSRWLVNNFYNLASNSEKGIIAGVTPLDKYLMDLNNGQSFYRPSYMLVAVLKNDTLPQQYQAAINRVYHHFYRNDFVYDHSRDNCSGISIDTLRTLGWEIPTRGVESQLKATAAYFYVSATERSLTKGRAIYDYLNTETTLLFPAVAFDAIGNDLLNQANARLAMQQADSAFITKLRQDIEAIYFVRIPQIPSSRAYGLAPVYSFNQFMAQAPADRSQWKIVPVTPNPLPEDLKNGLALKLKKPSLVPWPVVLVLLGLFTLALLSLKRHIRH